MSLKILNCERNYSSGGSTYTNSIIVMSWELSALWKCFITLWCKVATFKKIFFFFRTKRLPHGWTEGFWTEEL